MRISDWSSDVCSSDLDDFGYQLGRHWGIGQQGRDNGALLIVAPSERAVRIEVGYGLAGDLPDATAHATIANEILPAFRQGASPAGIAARVDAIVLAFAGAFDALERGARGGGVEPTGFLIVGSLVSVFAH